jgi:nicotinate-nucleotide adenylyltransferase
MPEGAYFEASPRVAAESFYVHGRDYATGNAMKQFSRVHAQSRAKRAPPPPLGILGGIFDPVHNGHCAAACLARDYFGLDKVYLIPSGTPPHKSGRVFAGPDHRLAMLKLAVKGARGLTVWDEELRRPGISYTVDTILRIREKHPLTPLYFIIGSDNLHEIVTWHEYRRILASVVLCVAHRPGFALAVPRELRAGKILSFPSPEWSVSSTMVRSYLSRGYSCDYLLPLSVAAYISRHRLYKKVQGGGRVHRRCGR